MKTGSSLQQIQNERLRMKEMFAENEATEDAYHEMNAMRQEFKANLNFSRGLRVENVTKIKSK